MPHLFYACQFSIRESVSFPFESVLFVHKESHLFYLFSDYLLSISQL